MSGGNNGKVLTFSRKLAKILTDSRKSRHPIETLSYRIINRRLLLLLCSLHFPVVSIPVNYRIELQETVHG